MLVNNQERVVWRASSLPVAEKPKPVEAPKMTLAKAALFDEGVLPMAAKA